ncbi:MAG: hypothetical protein HYZ50_22350 [Deltaproteobacteria bacterium]|nr:hypothetical protein [Deltaproteobacteria bacterium]
MSRNNVGSLLRAAFEALVVAFTLIVFDDNRVAAEEETDLPEVSIGERLFLEMRFAQFFFMHSHGDANAMLAYGDPVLDATTTTVASFPGPFAGQSMNCRACHLVDEHSGQPGGGNRTYADFARRSPVSAREDGQLTTPRNSPPLVNAALFRRNFLLHFDGEFRTMEDLVKGTLTGRNYGWLPQETEQASAHIAHIIRQDDGNGDLAQKFGGAYRVVLAGVDPALPPEFRLSPQFRITDVARASDEKILNVVEQLIAAYVNSLEFARDEEGAFTGSPFDVFLRKNGLPQQPNAGESPLAYSRRLVGLVEALTAPIFVNETDGTFTTHAQPFVFAAQELAGFKIFAREPLSLPLSSEALVQGGIGNCAACHPLPALTDFSFHNTGATQEEYDAIHGAGAFAALSIPDLDTRKGNFELFLPPTAKHPQAFGPFLAVPAFEKRGLTDLGLWNVFANPDKRKAQQPIRHLLTQALGVHLSPRELLPRTIALFKTPGLRDLSHSAPYLHTGGKDTLTDVIQFYRAMADLARRGALRNGAPQLEGIALTPTDGPSLAAFLRALNEDYE